MFHRFHIHLTLLHYPVYQIITLQFLYVLLLHIGFNKILLLYQYGNFQINNDYLSRIRFVLQRSNALDERAYILNPDTLQETGEYMQLGASESGLIYHKHNSDGTNSLIWQSATKNEFKTERIQSISFGYMGEDQNILYLNFSITSNIFYSVRFNIAANDKIRLYRVENNVYTQVWSL